MPQRARHARRLGATLTAAAVLGGLLVAPTAAAAEAGYVGDPASYVDTFTGTGSGGAVVGSINNFPGPAAPFGMMQFSPANGDNGTGYRNGDTRLQGFATNFASQGCTAFGNFPVLPTTINPTTGTPWTKTSTIVGGSEVGQVGYLAMDTKDNAGNTVGAQLTATSRTGVAVFTFPEGTTPAVLFRSGRMNNKDAIKSSLNVNPTNGTVTGWAVSKGFCGATQDNQYRVAFTATFEQPFTAYGAWDEGASSITNKVVGTDTGDAQVAGVQKAGGYVRFAPGTTKVYLKISLSFVGNGDLAQWTAADPDNKPSGGAALNLATEVPTQNFAAPGTTPYPSYQAAFDAVRQDTYDSWNDVLGRIKVPAAASSRDIGTFYHSLYRVFLHPNVLDDVDGRYPGFEPFNYLAAGASGSDTPITVHTLAESNTRYGLSQQHVYANLSDWDTYRSWAPLVALLAPKEASDIAQSYVLFADQWGRFPRWSIANQSTGQMSGDNATALIAQVHAFGADDFATGKALYWMYQVALGPDAGVAASGVDNQNNNKRKATRPGAKDYTERRYAPQTEDFQTDHAVTGASIAQEWSIDDFAAGRFAEAVGSGSVEGVPADVADSFAARSNYWQNHLNPLTGCLSPRDYAGRFPVGTNCNSTPSDFGYRGSVSGYGQVGFDEATSEQYLWLAPQNIDGLATALGGRAALADRLDTFMTGGYNVGANVPRMWLGNEPNFATPWIYNYLGRPWRTQEVVEEMRTRLWGTGRDGSEPGNDDLGAMSSWYVWAALGIYPATPGTDVLTVNAPNFEKAELTLGNGHTLTINAPGASSKRYVAGLAVDGVPQTSTALPDGWRDGDTTLDFTMADKASAWGGGTKDAPPSWQLGSNPTIAYADPVTVAPATTGVLNLAIQRVAATASTYSLDLTDVPAGIGVKVTTATDFDSTGHALQPLKVSVASGVAEGDYTFPVVVIAGGKRHATDVTVRVASQGGFLAQTNVQAISATAANAGGFDSTSSFERDLLEAAGLKAGTVVNLQELTGNAALAALTVRLPRVSEGLTDSIVPNGQKVVLKGSPTKVSFVGAAANGNTPGTASITLDDGTVVTGVDLGFGDWVLPSSTGSKLDGTLAPYGTNAKVVWTPHRNGQGGSANPGAYVYATAPYTAPAGRTIVAVTLNGSSGDNRRVLAIAQDTPDGATPPPTQSVSATSVAAGGSVTVTGAGFAKGETVNVFLGDRAVATVVAATGGTVTATVAIPRLQAPGTYRLQLVGDESGAAAATDLTVTEATWAPALTVAATALVGSQLSFTATGFGESEAVTATFGDAEIALYASASGKVTGSIATPAQAGDVKLTLTGVSSGATVSKTVTVKPLLPGPEVKVTLSASPALLTFGGNVVLTAQVPAGTKGSIRFLDGARVLGESAISNSRASLTVKGLTAGSHPVKAIETVSKATSPTVHVVVTKTTIRSIKVVKSTYRRGKTAKVTVTLGSLPGGRLASGVVTLKVGSKVVGKVSVTGGFKVTVKVGGKYTKAKKLVVKAVFTPTDTRNLLPRTSPAVTLTGRR